MKRTPYWHIHHDILMEYPSISNTERRSLIKRDKPKHEIVLRLQLLKPVKSKLPSKIIKAREAYLQKERNFHRVHRAYLRSIDSHRKASRANTEAFDTLNVVELIYEKVLAENKAKIEALHAKECLNCPWDGQTIFPKKGVSK